MSNPFIAGLEQLDALEGKNSTAPVEELFTVESEMLDIAMSELAVEEVESNMLQASKMYDSIFESFASLENLANVIEAEGISKSLMAYADPEGYLHQNLGFPSLEELDVTPIKDQNAIIALEAISDKMKSFGDTIVKYFNMIVAAMNELFKKIMAMFNTYETVLKKFDKKFKSFKFDAKKAEKKEVTLPAQKTLVAAFAEYVTVMDAALAVDLPGIYSSNKTDPEKMKTAYAAAFKDLAIKSDISGNEKKSLKALGYDASNIKNVIGGALKVLATVKDTKKAIDHYTKFAKLISGDVKGLEGDDAAKVKSAILVAKTFISNHKRTLSALISAAKVYAQNAVGACNAVSACSVGAMEKEEKAGTEDLQDQDTNTGDSTSTEEDQTLKQSKDEGDSTKSTEAKGDGASAEKDGDTEAKSEEKTTEDGGEIDSTEAKDKKSGDEDPAAEKDGDTEAKAEEKTDEDGTDK